ncbi:MAG: NAD-dependent epimerase/dehydratase family protein [Bacteroidetes bacterium]|nr:NAD-dependent epimerase/dehydratase family protein [Bacteroidota bacterium]
MKKILVTGAVGQIGSELTLALRDKYGAEHVIATGRKTEPSKELKESGPFHFIDVNSVDSVEEMIKKYEIDTIIHMAAILSGVGEKNPMLAWDVNMNGTLNILNLGVKYDMARVIIPSSIAVWGPGTPSVAPQDTALHPTTMYGVTKVAGEILADYYVLKYGLDSRGLRYPGIISSETLPGGGTTDYAVAIYYEAVKNKKYTCFVREDTRLPMMYMPDCIKATIDLMEAPFDKLNRHNDYNVGSMSFTAKDLANAIKKHIPDFVDSYEPDFRQAIADSWPDDVEDDAARKDWGWDPSHNIESMTKDMLEKLQARHAKGELE